MELHRGQADGAQPSASHAERQNYNKMNLKKLEKYNLGQQLKLSNVLESHLMEHADTGGEITL